MILGCVALMISSLIGGLSHSVITYVIAAMVLGIYFACSSGTVDSIVYDAVLEETGSNELYETWIGRIRAVESAGFVLSSLALSSSLGRSGLWRRQRRPCSTDRTGRCWSPHLA
jgi:hypothetical protein